jgi:hypothetical protein
MIHKNHLMGDEALNRVDHPRIIGVEEKEFVPIRYRKAIGGCQIVQGSFAREHGYLDRETRWHQPTNNPFGNKGKGTHTPEDVKYRLFCREHGKMIADDIPNCYRIRHSEGVNDNVQVAEKKIEVLAD